MPCQTLFDEAADGASPWQLLATALAILVLAGAVLVVRFGHLRFPYPETDEEERETRLT